MLKRTKNEEQERVCALCEHGTLVPEDSEGNVFVLCSKKGMVRDTSVCRKYSYDPLKREPAAKRALPEMEKIDLDEI